MAGGLKTYGRVQSGNWITNRTFYADMTTTVPTATSTDTSFSGGNYSRLLIPAGTLVYNSGSGLWVPGSDLDWGIWFDTDLGTAQGVVLWDASTGGNAWLWSALATPLVFAAKDRAVIPAASLSFQQL